MSNTPVEVQTGRSRRRFIAMASAIAVVVAAGVVLGLWRTVGRSPTERHLTLSTLAGTTWDPNVFVSYDVHDVHVATTMLRLEMREVAGSGQATVIDDIWVQPRAVPGAAGVPAHIDVASLGSVPPDAAVASIFTVQRQVVQPDKTTPMADLPAGWQGIVMGTDNGGYGDAEVVGIAGSQLVRISISSSVGDPSADTATVTRDAGQLVAAIASWGIPRFSNVVSRPRGWW